MQEKKLFGTDGIRGLANEYPMTCEVALNLGRAVVNYFRHHIQYLRPPVIVVGKDTRNSCYMFEQAFCAGVCSLGGMAIVTGPLPTPGVAFVTKSMRANAGVMISASHNPFRDNGIKLFDSLGYKLSNEVEVALENMVLNPITSFSAPCAPQDVGKVTRLDEVIGRYIVHVKSALKDSFSLQGKKIVLDCANGAAYKVGPQIFTELGAQVFTIGVSPNGFNINENCGSEKPDQCAQMVVDLKADFGICFDGDGDRVVIIDRKGRVINGDAVIGLMALYLSRQDKKKLKNPKVVGTVMSNLGLELFLNKNKIEFHRSAVGDRNVSHLMREQKAFLGGEPSGHILLNEFTTTGDGILTSLKFLEALDFLGEEGNQILESIPVFPQIIKNIPITEKIPFDQFPTIQKKLGSVQKALGEEGRVILRYSGTENLVRIMMEGKKYEIINELTDELSHVVAKELSV